MYVYGMRVSLFVCGMEPIHIPCTMSRCLHTIRYKSKSAASGNALESGLNSQFPIPFPIPIPIPFPIPFPT